MKIKKIMILVELDNGHAHQVLASKEQKEVCLALLRTDERVLNLSKRIDQVIIKKYTEENEQTTHKIN